MDVTRVIQLGLAAALREMARQLAMAANDRAEHGELPTP